MAKQFLANRSGQTPTLDEVPNEVIKIYNDKAAADLDIANIEENEIVATKAGESEGVEAIVDCKLRLLWTNPNPSSTFAATTIDLGVTDKPLLIEYNPQNSLSRSASGIILPNTNNSNWIHFRYFTGSAGSFTYRDATRSFTLNNGILTIGNGVLDASDSAAAIIPLKIYTLGD